jgi:hypothetical protein
MLRANPGDANVTDIAIKSICWDGMRKTGAGGIAKANRCLSVALVLLPLLFFLVAYLTYGPYWDVVAHYLNGKTIINLIGGNINPLHLLSGENGYNLRYYFEPYRAPVEYLLFAALSTVFKNPILPYFIVAYALFLFAILKLSEEARMDMALLLLLFVNASVVFFWFMVNGEEILSIIFAILGIVYLIKDRPVSGLFFALSVLGKYPALVLLPMVFLLTTRKKIVSGIAFELLALLPFFAFNYLLYGFPITTLFLSFQASAASYIPAAVSWGAMLDVFGYPLAILIIVVTFVRLCRKNAIKTPNLGFRKMDRTERILAVLLVLSVVDFFLTALYHDAVTQTRYGYLLLFSLILILAHALSPIVRADERLRLVLLCFGMLAFATVILTTAYGLNNGVAHYYNYDNPDSIYSNASAVLDGLGYGNCRVVSNAWVPLLYLNVDAYSPFASPEHYNASISQVFAITNSIKVGASAPLLESATNNTLEIVNQNSFPRYDSDAYPIIVFKHTGVSPGLIVNLNSSSVLYDGPDIAVLAPMNVTCYRS